MKYIERNNKAILKYENEYYDEKYDNFEILAAKRDESKNNSRQSSIGSKQSDYGNNPHKVIQDVLKHPDKNLGSYFKAINYLSNKEAAKSFKKKTSNTNFASPKIKHTGNFSLDNASLAHKKQKKVLTIYKGKSPHKEASLNNNRSQLSLKNRTHNLSNKKSNKLLNMTGQFNQIVIEDPHNNDDANNKLKFNNEKVLFKYELDNEKEIEEEIERKARSKSRKNNKDQKNKRINPFVEEIEKLVKIKDDKRSYKQEEAIAEESVYSDEQSLEHQDSTHTLRQNQSKNLVSNNFNSKKSSNMGLVFESKKNFGDYYTGARFGTNQNIPNTSITNIFGNNYSYEDIEMEEANQFETKRSGLKRRK